MDLPTKSSPPVSTPFQIFTVVALLLYLILQEGDVPTANALLLLLEDWRFLLILSMSVVCILGLLLCIVLTMRVLFKQTQIQCVLPETVQDFAPRSIPEESR